MDTFFFTKRINVLFENFGFVIIVGKFIILFDFLLFFTGFPLESQLSPGKAWVYQDPEFRGGTNFAYYDDAESNRAQSSSQLDVNAREFVPKNLLIDDEAAASGDDVASTHSSNSLR